MNPNTNWPFLTALLFTLSFAAPIAGFGQASSTSSSWKRVWIADSGCSATFPAGATNTESGLDVDSNKVYVFKATTMADGIEYLFYVSVMQLREEPGEADEALVGYMDYVKSTQLVAHAAGFRKINPLLRGKLAKGIVDTWTDHAGNEYAVTGWAKGRTLVLMYAVGEKPYPNKAQLNGFFNSFQFPSAF